MKITREQPDSAPGPEESFTGEVWFDPIASPPEPARARVLSVHFTPGARTAWHKHPFGQIIYVTEGEGRVRCKGGPVERLRAGDVVYFEPDEDHWHGAAPKRFMTHIAIQEADEDGVPRLLGRARLRRGLPDGAGRGLRPSVSRSRSSGSRSSRRRRPRPPHSSCRRS